MQTFRCPKPLSNCSRYDIADTSILRGKKLSHAMTAMSSMFSSLASPAKNDAHCAFCHCHTCQTSGNSYQSYGSPFTSDSIGSLIQEPKKIVFPWMALNNIKTSVISLTFSQHFRTCSSLLLSLVVGLALDVGPGWHCPNAWADAKEKIWKILLPSTQTPLRPDRCILVPLLSLLLPWLSFRQEIFTWSSAIAPVKREQSMGACGCTRSQDVTRHTVSSFPSFPSYCDFSTVSLSAPSP